MELHDQSTAVRALTEKDRLILSRALRLNTEIARVLYLEEKSLWKIEKSDGQVVYARFVVSACGGLRIPQVPNFSGRELFVGRQFHTARWPKNFSPKNLSIAIVGSAASAIQILPELAREASRVYLFQRTPNYITPRDDQAFSEKLKGTLARFPWLMRVIRWVLFCFLDFVLFRSFFLNSRANVGRENAALEYMRSQISEKSLQEKLTPHYPIGCKRVLLSDDFYPALNRENVELVTQPIERLTANSVVTSPEKNRTSNKADMGRPVDVIIYATGYDVSSPTGDLRVEGLHSASLKETWAHEKKAHRGVAMNGFPNLFFVVGPNSGLGHNSIVFIIEQQVNYIIKCIKQLPLGSSMMVSEEAMHRYNETLRSGFKGKVWTGGCESWYMNNSGHNPALWPYRSLSYWWAMRRPDFSEYEFSAPKTEPQKN